MYSFLFFLHLCYMDLPISLSGAVISVSPPSDEAAKASVSTAPKTLDSERYTGNGISQSPLVPVQLPTTFLRTLEALTIFLPFLMDMTTI